MQVALLAERDSSRIEALDGHYVIPPVLLKQSKMDIMCDDKPLTDSFSEFSAVLQNREMRARDAVSDLMNQVCRDVAVSNEDKQQRFFDSLVQGNDPIIQSLWKAHSGQYWGAIEFLSLVNTWRFKFRRRCPASSRANATDTLEWELGSHLLKLMTAEVHGVDVGMDYLEASNCGTRDADNELAGNVVQAIPYSRLGKRIVEGILFYKDQLEHSLRKLLEDWKDKAEQLLQ